MAQSAKINQKLKIALIALLVVAGIVLLWLPKDYFNDGQAVCLSVVFFDTECYGCGMTRAIQHLIHLDFEQAWSYNKLSFVVFPLFVYLIITEVLKIVKEIKQAKER